MKNKELFIDGSYKHTLTIPGNWEFLQLNELVEITGGSQPPKSDFITEPGEGLVRLIQIRDYKSDKYKIYIPLEKARRFCTKDDIMIGRYGPPIFQILKGLEGAYNVALMKAEPKFDFLDSEYLFEYLKNQNIYNYVESASDRTAGQSGVNKKHLEKYPIPLPPHAEQKQIAFKLDELLEQVDIIKTRLDVIPNILKRFRQSVITSATTGNLTREWRKTNKTYAVLNDWLECTLGDVVEYGKTQKIEPKDISDDTWVLELEDIEKESSIVLQRKKQSERKVKSSKNVFKKGDVLYGKLRPYLDKVLIADSDGVCTTEIIPLKENDRIIKDYLFISLKTPIFLNYVDKVNHGVNMPRLGTKAGQAAPLSLPPMDEQAEIVSLVKQYFSFSSQIEQRVKEAQTRVNNLTKSILAKAFRGDLTAEWREQNPDLISGENSAEALLERIKSERNHKKNKRKTKA